MGPEMSTSALYLGRGNGKFKIITDIEETSAIKNFDSDKLSDNLLEYKKFVNESPFTFKINFKYWSRKKFIKKLMSKGIQRNDAKKYADVVYKTDKHYSVFSYYSTMIFISNLIGTAINNSIGIILDNK